tara:strand:+ start:735 stop:1691 length:957 start_codon:yes stop_codon:yes gene_type:complete
MSEEKSEKKERKSILERFKDFRKNYLGFSDDEASTLVEEVKSDSPYGNIKDLSQISEAFGGVSEIPEKFQPIKGLNIKKGRISGDRAAVLDIKKNLKFKDLDKDEEIRQIPFSGFGGRDPQYEIVKKGAPYSGIPRVFAGTIDLISGDRLDLDRRGKKGDEKRIVDIYDPENYLVSPVEAKKIEQELEKAGIEPTNKSDSLGDLDSNVEKQLEIFKKLDEYETAKRDRESIKSAAFQFGTEPLRQYFLNRAGQTAQDRLIRGLFQMEATPSNIQRIMKSKQEQQNLAADSEYRRALGVAAQQDAATRFAGLGMQRQFG